MNDKYYCNNIGLSSLTDSTWCTYWCCVTAFHGCN